MSRTDGLRSAVPFVICLLLLLSVNTGAAELGAGKPQKSSTGAVLRSLAVPGWGQLYNEAYFKALFFAASEGILIGRISKQHDLMMRFKTGGNSLKEQIFRERRNKLLWWLAGFVLLSCGDAYVDAHMYGLDISPDLSLTEGIYSGLKVSVRF